MTASGTTLRTSINPAAWACGLTGGTGAALTTGEMATGEKAKAAARVDAARIRRMSALCLPCREVEVFGLVAEARVTRRDVCPEGSPTGGCNETWA